MKRKLYWGVATLIVVLIGTGVLLFVTTDKDTEPIIIYKDVEPSKDIPPPAEEGFKWVWHINHWDKIPIEQKPIVENVVSKPAPVVDSNDVAELNAEVDISEIHDFSVTIPDNLFTGNLDLSNPNATQRSSVAESITDIA